MASSQKKQQQKMKMLMMLSALFLLPLLAMATRVPMEQQGHPDHEDDLGHPDHPHGCICSIFVKTSWKLFAGTSGTISLYMSDSEGNEKNFPDLEKIGLMEPGWLYFQQGNLDLFSGKGRHLKSGPCKITLTLNATGPSPKWRCDSVQVTESQNGNNCTTHFFSVRRWFTRLSPTYTVDNCPNKNSVVTENDGHGGLPLPIQSESE